MGVAPIVNKQPTVPDLTLEKMGKIYNAVLELEHENLLSTLFFFWDGFERASMNFFLVKDTAKQVIAGGALSGNKLTLGIRRMEWNGGAERVFKAFMEHNNILPVETTNDFVLFSYNQVPVYLYIYEENPCLDSLDVVFYNNETFNTPNPFKTFCEKYDK